MPLFDLEFSKYSYSRALVSACGALVFLTYDMKNLSFLLFFDMLRHISLIGKRKSYVPLARARATAL